MIDVVVPARGEALSRSKVRANTRRHRLARAEAMRREDRDRRKAARFEARAIRALMGRVFRGAL